MNIGLILAGGKGKRSGEKIPKQFVKVNNKPMIVYTLEKFQECHMIDAIYISCIETWMNQLNNYVLKYGISKVKKIIKGGKTGLDSVYKGLQGMSNHVTDDDLILIHDAARPFVDNQSLENNIKVAQKYGLAMSSIDCVETLVYSNDGIYADKIIPRDNIKRILTPQTFKYGILKELYKDFNYLNTTEPSTFSFYMNKGLPIYCSKDSEKNIKITCPADIAYFKKLFNE